MQTGQALQNNLNAQTQSDSPNNDPMPTATSAVLETGSTTPVAEMTMVHPSRRTVLESGYATVIFPTESRERMFQVSLDRSSVSGEECFALSVYTAEGEMERDARLIQPAEIIVTLDADRIEGIGGPAFALQTYALGGISIQVNDVVRGNWNHLVSWLDIKKDGSFKLRAKTRVIRPIPYCIRMGVDWAALELVRVQMNGTPTPTITPPPTVPPTPTFVPASAPVDVETPNTGDSHTPFALLLVVAVISVGISLWFSRLMAERAGRR